MNDESFMQGSQINTKASDLNYTRIHSSRNSTHHRNM